MSRERVALIQRYIPHYRVSFFRKLHRTSKYAWEFLCGGHPGPGESGLDSLERTDLPIRSIRVFSSPNGRIVYEGSIARYLYKQRYDAVVLELGLQIISNVPLLIAARGLKVPPVGWTKGIPETGLHRSFLARSYQCLLARACRALIVYGEVSKRYFEEMSYPSNRLFIAQNTVDVTEILISRASFQEQADQLRESLHVDDRPVIGYLGRLTEQKRVDLIISAFAVARRAGLNAKLLIAGDGPERSKLEELARFQNLGSSVRFVGSVTAQNEGAYFQLFDLVVSARATGLAILEAMAHGKPVLITPEVRPETELIVHRKTGYVANGFSASSLSDAFLDVCRDIPHMRQVGANAEQKVAMAATQERMVESFDSALDSVFEGT